MVAASHTSHLILNMCFKRSVNLHWCTSVWVYNEFLKSRVHPSGTVLLRSDGAQKPSECASDTYGRHHGELTCTPSLSSAGPATPRRSARSCSLRCSSATESTLSRPCTVPAWPSSTWPASSEPRWAAGRTVLRRVGILPTAAIRKCADPIFVDATLLKINPTVFHCQKFRGGLNRRFLSLS